MLRFDDVRFAATNLPISFHVGAGTFTVVHVGDARCSAVVRAALGLVAPIAGDISTLGLDPGSLNRREAANLRRRIGSALQPMALLSSMTLLDNVALALMYEPHSGGTARERALAALDATGVADFADARPADVTNTVRTCATIARALVRRPELMLLDDVGLAAGAATVDRIVTACRAWSTTTLAVVSSPRDPMFVRRDIDALSATHELDSLRVEITV
jgi:ABC-type methionine transport system ATPase subunit